MAAPLRPPPGRHGRGRRGKRLPLGPGLDRGQVGQHRPQQPLAQARGPPAMQEHPEPPAGEQRQLGTAPGRHGERQHGRGGRLLQRRAVDGKGQEIEPEAGAEAARRALDRPRFHRGARRHRHDRAGGGRCEFENRQGRDRPQEMWPQQRQQAVRQLRQFFVQALAQPAGEEGEAFHQPLDIRVRCPPRQQAGDRRVGFAEGVAEVVEIGELVLVVAVDAHRHAVPSARRLVDGRVMGPPGPCRRRPPWSRPSRAASGPAWPASPSPRTPGRGGVPVGGHGAR